MSNYSHDDDLTDAWLVEATREMTSSESPEGDVERLITSISSTLSRIHRPARRLATDDRGILISDRVVKQLVGRAVRQRLDRLVVFASVDGDDDAVDAIRVGLIARYADDLVALSDQVRDLVEEVLVSTVGSESSATGRKNIAVRWQDLYTREWLPGPDAPA